MIKIIGYTDSVTECDCCGKTELKGTYCILDIDGEELYYGSTCAFKSNVLDKETQKELKENFTKQQKNAKLYDLHIAPIKKQLVERLENAFTTNFDNLSAFERKIYNQIESDYNRVIQSKIKKYKIIL